MKNIKNAIALIAIGCAMVAYCSSTFVSKDSHDDIMRFLVKRLDRIEQKLDNVLGIR